MRGLGLGLGLSVLQSAAAAPPLPTTGLVSRYTCDVGYGAGVWNDQVGSNHLTVTGTTTGATQNGRVAVRFDGVDDVATKAVFALGGEGTVSIFGVVRVLGGSGNKGIVSYADGLFDNHGFGHTSGTALLQNAVLSEPGTVSLTSAVRRVGTIQRAQVNTDILYVDGVQDATQASVSTVANNKGFYIGFGNDLLANVDVWEMLVYNVAVTVADVDNYLKARHGL